MLRIPCIWIISDDSRRVEQSLALANRLGGERFILSIADIDHAGGAVAFTSQYFPEKWPDTVIGAGEKTAQYVSAIKQLSKQKTYAVILLDPHMQHQDFDLIALPGYEPYTDGNNIIPTIGLLNRINSHFLENEKEAYKQGKYRELAAASLPTPYYAVLVGGRHVGGNITVADMEKLAAMFSKLVQQSGGSILVATSSRTEKAASDALRKHITVPYFFYDYKYDRHMPNPYNVMLALADGVVVTGDSVRMCSEACSTGKPVSIYMPPSSSFSPYHALHQQLVSSGYATFFTGDPILGHTPPLLDEAGRIAERIKQSVSAS